MEQTKLLQELGVLLAEGDKEKTEDFLVEHFKEFSEEMQREIIFTFLDETADNYLKEKISKYLAQSAALRGLGEALKEEIEKSDN